MLALFLAKLITVTLASGVIFEDCGSSYKLHSVNIEGCGWALPCYITLGEETPVRLEFYADFSSNLLDQNVVINVNLVNVEANVTPDNCVTVECPVTTGAVNAFHSVMSVPERMALNQRGFLRWRVFNERNLLVICYSVMVQTQSPAQKRLRQLLSVITAQHANAIVDNLDLYVDKDLNLDLDSDDDKNRDYLQLLVDLYFEQLKSRPQARMAVSL